MKKIFLIAMLFLPVFPIMADAPTEADAISADMHHHRGNPHRDSPHRREPVLVIPPYSQDEALEIASSVKKLSFDKDKMMMAELFVKVRPVTVDGLESISKAFAFDDNRKDFLIFAYDYCVDKDQYYKLRKVFDFSSNAEKMFEKLGI